MDWKLILLAVACVIMGCTRITIERPGMASWHSHFPLVTIDNADTDLDVTSLFFNGTDETMTMYFTWRDHPHIMSFSVDNIKGVRYPGLKKTGLLIQADLEGYDIRCTFCSADNTIDFNQAFIDLLNDKYNQTYGEQN